MLSRVTALHRRRCGSTAYARLVQNVDDRQQMPVILQGGHDTQALLLQGIKKSADVGHTALPKGLCAPHAWSTMCKGTLGPKLEKPNPPHLCTMAHASCMSCTGTVQGVFIY